MLTCAAWVWVMISVGEVLHWDFTDPAASAEWMSNSDAGRQEITADGWRIVPSGPDPQLITAPLDIEIADFAMVYLRLSASQEGVCQLFWSRDDGEMMGFSEACSRRFHVNGGGEDTSIVLIPGWTRGTHLRRLRFDPFADATFTLKEIRIIYPFEGRAPQQIFPPADKVTVLPGPPAGEQTALPQDAWIKLPAERTLWCGPLDIDTASITGLMLQSDQQNAGQARPWRFLWVQAGSDQIHEAVGWLWPSDGPQWVRLDGYPGWTGRIIALGVGPPAGVSLKALQPAQGDDFEPWPIISRFGRQDPVWRAGRPCRILARVENRGGGTVRADVLRLTAADSEGHPLNVHAQKPSDQPLRWGEYQDLMWEVTAERPGSVDLRLEGMACGGSTRIGLQVSPAATIPGTDYVPAPDPPRLPFDVCAFYFPGWNGMYRWSSIVDRAPERLPALGYYDEGNPECVDWQIKWSLDHGITCYLVDWYWVQGRRSLTHWFEAYRRARYRDQLKVAIIWANHNPPGTHSREDWRAVTREWIDHYFNLPAYFRIDDRPAVFLWDPRGLRRDLGSEEEVKAALADSQQMAREAGYAGISFVMMGYGFSASEFAALREAGFMGWTTYHEWEHAAVRAWSRQEVAYEDLVVTSPEAWQQRKSRTDTAGLTYYPVVDTGWDARPWHGNSSLVIMGRTPERFERLTTLAREFTLREKLPFMVIGPINEWGEGSYIEPNAEYGMTMFQALRRGVTGESGSIPDELYPADLGRGPFDFPMPNWENTVWPFTPEASWTVRGGGMTVRKESEGWRITVRDASACLTHPVYGFNASAHSQGVIRMAITPVNPAGENISLQGRLRVENLDRGILAEKSFAVVPDGTLREYRIDLGGDNPRWYGRPAQIMLYPVNQEGFEVLVSCVALEPMREASES